MRNNTRCCCPNGKRGFVFLLFGSSMMLFLGVYFGSVRLRMRENTNAITFLYENPGSFLGTYVRGLMNNTAATVTVTKSPTKSPNAAPTNAPIQASMKAPTPAPTKMPTPSPTKTHTVAPTKAPSKAPTRVPTTVPTKTANTSESNSIPKSPSKESQDGVAMPIRKPPTDMVPLRSSNYSICVTPLGGLGNQMFEFATIYGLAARKRMNVFIAKNDHLTRVFKLDIELKEKARDICKTFVGRGERINCGYDQKMATFPANNNYRLGAYLQSWMYFYNASTGLRKQFTFQDSIVEGKNKVLNTLLKKQNVTSRKNVTLIGVHVRRGDLVNHRFGYNVASSDYLKKAVNYFLSKGLKNIVFIVCSNDIKWTREHMPKGIRSEYSTGNSAEFDMALLGSCDHMISTVGTFSWWAGWLTGGEVTFYKWPAKEGSGLRKHFSKDYVDFFHPGWIGFT